jgi:hypothetical protein
VVPLRLKAGVVETENTAVARKWLSKQIPPATNKYQWNTLECCGFYVVRILLETLYAVIGKYAISSFQSRVEAWSNISTAALRVVGSDEKGTQCLWV